MLDVKADKRFPPRRARFGLCYLWRRAARRLDCFSVSDHADRRRRGWACWLHNYSSRTLMGPLLCSHMLVEFWEEVSREERVNVRVQV